jgi:hypothetical protein
MHAAPSRGYTLASRLASGRRLGIVASWHRGGGQVAVHLRAQSALTTDPQLPKRAALCDVGRKRCDHRPLGRRVRLPASQPCSEL